MALSTESLAKSSARHPWRVVVVWIGLIILSVFIAGTLLSDVLTTDADFTNEPEAKKAERLIEEGFMRPEQTTEIVVVTSETSTADQPEYEAFVGDLTADLEGLGPDVVQGVGSYLTEEGPVSDDGTTALLFVTMAGTFDDATENQDQIVSVLEGTEGSGYTTLVTGEATLNNDFIEVSEQDLRRGESIGILAALVVLLVVFGAVIAALLPILLGIAAIVVAVAITALVGQGFELSFFVVNMIVMMGLAVGIDYSLFIVSRFREERRHGREKLEAIRVTGSSASRAVFFSGMTVVLALMGLLIVPQTIFRSLAAGAIFVVLMAVLASMTLLPAVLSLLGDRVNSLAIPYLGRRLRRTTERQGGFWDRVAHGVMAKPWLSLALAAGLLIALALPYLSIHTGFSGVSTLSEELESRKAFDVMGEKGFEQGEFSPIQIVVTGDIDSPSVQAGTEDLQEALIADQRFGQPQVEVDGAGDLAVISAPVAGDPFGDAATESIVDLREDVVPAAFPEGTADEVLVGGTTAENKDFFDLADTYTPVVFAFVLGLSFLLLTVVFRSIVLPVKAIILNLLSVGAAYGLVVLMTQENVGPGWIKSIADFLGFQQIEAVEAWIPIFLFAVLFGLSMDYHVFLLSRIRERYYQTHDNTAAVAYGVRTTAGIITGAALIMVAVFSGFASGDLVGFQQMGFGLAVAVLIDATIVRSVLVPSTMKLLGEWNWYLPSWLQWLPQIKVEAHAAETELPAAAREPAAVSGGADGEDEDEDGGTLA